MHPMTELAEQIWKQPDVRAAHTNGERSVLVTGDSGPRRRWPSVELPASKIKGKPGAGMIRVATGLLFALGIGLLGVSFAAQYAYVDAQRHQHIASVIEAGALDIGMVIFALLALGLARAGLGALAPRACVIACAAGSAVMNYAAADVSSPRSVLAFIMPPLFLALVVDQVAVTIRKHVMGIEDRSAWAIAGRIMLWAARTLLDPWATAIGARRMVLNATPLPAPVRKPAITSDGGSGPKATRGADPRPGSKTSRFIALVIDRHGPLTGIPLDRVSPICTELASEVDLDEGAARTALRARVLAAQEQ